MLRHLFIIISGSIFILLFSACSNKPSEQEVAEVKQELEYLCFEALNFKTADLNQRQGICDCISTRMTSYVAELHNKDKEISKDNFTYNWQKVAYSCGNKYGISFSFNEKSYENPYQ